MRDVTRSVLGYLPNPNIIRPFEIHSTLDAVSSGFVTQFALILKNLETLLQAGRIYLCRQG